jgi:outer membrane protein assembly factor BamB
VSGDLVCLEAATGKPIWQKSLVRDFGGGIPNWGYSESPLVDGDQVVCSPGGQGGTLAAFDKETGQLRWRSTGLSAKAGYSSVVVSEAGGVRHYVQMTGDGVAGFSPKDGTVLWQQPDVAVNRTAVIPTPVVRGDHVFVTSGYGAGCGLIKLTADGRGGLKPEVVYKNRNMVNHHGGVVLVGDHLYGYSDDGRQWRCLEFQTGKVVWGSNKLEKGAIGYADGKLFCYGEQTGTLVVVDASPDGWRESGRFTLPKKTSRRRPRGGIWPHPVVADGKLFLRDQELLYCFDVRAPRAGE